MTTETNANRIIRLETEMTSIGREVTEIKTMVGDLAHKVDAVLLAQTELSVLRREMKDLEEKVIAVPRN